MTPEERKAAVRDLIAQGFNDDEIMGAIDKRSRAKPKAEETYTDEAGQVVEPGALSKLPGRVAAAPGLKAGLADMIPSEDDFRARQARQPSAPNMLQRAFPKRGPSTDPIQSDPLAQMIIGGVVGSGAGALAAPLGRIAAGAAAGSVGNVVSGSDPVSGGLIGAGVSAIPVVGKLAGRAGNTIATKLRESPLPRGLDLRVQAEHGVEPTLFGQKDPQGAMPDPKKYAPTDSGRGALGETNATELSRRKYLAKESTKKELDRGKARALRREGELPINTEAPTTTIGNAADDLSYTTGTKEQLEAVRQGLVTPKGSKENVSSLRAGADRRDSQAKLIQKRLTAGEPEEPAVIDRLRSEAAAMRARAARAAQAGEYSELDSTTVRRADQARDKADHYANEEQRMRPGGKQELPFQQTSAAIKTELDAVAPMLRRANKRYSRKMGGTERDPNTGEEISRGIQGADDLIKAQGPETYGTKLKSIGEDTGTGGAKLARHNRLKDVYEADIDPYSVQTGEPSSRLLLSQPQLLLAKQRQSFLGKKPAGLPSDGRAGITGQLLRQMTSLGEPFLNRVVYPQAKRVGRLADADLMPPEMDVLPSLLLSRKDRDNGRR